MGPIPDAITFGFDKSAVEIDPLGRQTLHFYDGQGNGTNTVFADLTAESFFFDAENRKIAMIDRAGRSMVYTNDALGRLITAVFPDGATTNAFYDAIGRLIAATGERGNPTWFGFDPNCGCSGRQITVTYSIRRNSKKSCGNACFGYNPYHEFGGANRLITERIPGYR